MKERGKLIVLSGPSGAGKSTVVALAMEKRDDICFSVSVTTRAPRPGEVDGKDYFFISDEEFRKMVEEDRLLEHAEYVSHCYGTPRNYVLEKLESGMNVILDIEVKGARQVKNKFPDAVLVFFAPPSLSVLRERLTGRGTETEETINARLERAGQEYTEADFYDWLVVNETPEQAAEELSAIITASHCRFCDRKDILK
ncbi:MAG: guanylate kinase [Eubacteriales bacterium]|nr:guanylate kinase [Eubacteriales bacterium]